MVVKCLGGRGQTIKNLIAALRLLAARLIIRLSKKCGTMTADPIDDINAEQIKDKLDKLQEQQDRLEGRLEAIAAMLEEALTK